MSTFFEDCEIQISKKKVKEEFYLRLFCQKLEKRFNAFKRGAFKTHRDNDPVAATANAELP